MAPLWVSMTTQEELYKRMSSVETLSVSRSSGTSSEANAVVGIPVSIRLRARIKYWILFISSFAEHVCASLLFYYNHLIKIRKNVNSDNLDGGRIFG